jgi:phosphatidylinositol 3-kinase
MTPLGSTIVSLFDKNLRLREGFKNNSIYILLKGKYNLIVWPNTIPDTSNSSSTPGLVLEKNIQDLNYSLIKQDELNRIINSPTNNSNNNDKRSFLNLVKKVHYTYKKVPAAFIEIEFPKFVYPVYFEERENLGKENFVSFPFLRDFSLY